MDKEKFLLVPSAIVGLLALTGVALAQTATTTPTITPTPTTTTSPTMTVTPTPSGGTSNVPSGAPNTGHGE